MFRTTFLAVAWAGLMAPLSAAVMEFDPERLVSLELSNGTFATGRIIDVQGDRLQLVRAGFNRMIAFRDLSPAARLSLGLPESLPGGQPAATTSLTPADQSGPHSTRNQLREALARFDASRYSDWSSQEYDPWSYGYWPAYYYVTPFYPWNPGCHRPVHHGNNHGHGGWNIHIKF